MSRACNEWWKERVAKSWEAIEISERGLNPTPPPQVVQGWDAGQRALINQARSKVDMSIYRSGVELPEECFNDLLSAFGATLLACVANEFGQHDMEVDPHDPFKFVTELKNRVLHSEQPVNNEQS